MVQKENFQVKMSVGALALLTLSVILSSVNVSAADFSSGTYYWNDTTNCTINTSTTYSDCTIYQKCDVDVTSDLAFDNVTFYINQSVAEEYEFKVSATGTFNMTNGSYQTVTAGESQKTNFYGIITMEDTTFAGDQEIDYVWLGSSNATLTNITMADAGYFNIKGDANLTLINSSIDTGYKIYLYENAVIEAYNTGLPSSYGTHLAFYLDCSNCRVYFYDDSVSDGTYIATFAVAPDVAKIYGFYDDSPYFGWKFEYATAFINRTFPIYVYKDTAETQPYSGVTVNVTRDGTLIYTDTTDSNGRVDLEIMINSTYADPFQFPVYADSTWIVNLSENFSTTLANVKFNITYVDAAPTVNLVSPSDSSTTKVSSVDFTCNISDIDSVANVSLYSNTTGVWHLNETNTSELNDTDYVFTHVIPDENEILWNCYGCDGAGQCTWGTSNWTVTVDSDPSPTVVLNDPTGGELYKSANVLFNCTPQDTENLTNVSLYVDYPSWHLNTTNTSGLNATDYIFNISIPDGETVTWNCYACDNASQCSWASSNETFVARTSQYWIYFIERDTSCPSGCDDVGDFANLYLSVGNTLVWNEADTSLHHLGKIGVDVTDYVVNGTSNFSLVVEYGSAPSLVYFKDVYIARNTSDGTWENVSFTPFTYTTPAADFRAQIRRELDIYAMLPYEAYWGGATGSAGDNLTIYSAMITLAPELEIRRSDLNFEPEYPNITRTSDILINATIRNSGSADASGVTVEFYINDALVNTSESFSVSKGSSYYVTHNYSTYSGGRDKIEVKIIYTGTEGLDRNNDMVKYIVTDTHHSYLFGNATASYGYNNLATEPYATMAAAMNTTADSYDALDYTAEDYGDRCQGAHYMGIRCLIYNETTTYCNKSMEALLYLSEGTNDWIWFNRSLEGNGTGLQEYGYSNTPHDSSEIGLDCAIGYDMIANYVVQYDSDHGTTYHNTIVDNLWHLASDYYLLNKEHYFSGSDWTINRGGDPVDENTKRLMTLCGLAATLQGTTSSYEDTDGNPWEWWEFCNETFVGTDQAGRPRNLLRWGSTEDGLMREGYYRYYHNDEVMLGSVAAYKAFGYSWYDTSLVFRNYIDQIPFTSFPGGLFPSRGVNFNALFPPFRLSNVLAENDPNKYAHYNWYVNGTLINNDNSYYTYGTVPHEALFTYNASATHRVYPNSTYISQNGSMSVLRSDWTDEAMWMWLIIGHDGTENGHIKDEGHQLSFSVFGKGAFPLIDCGDPRWLNMQSEDDFAQRGEGNNYMAIDGQSIALGSAIIQYYNPSYLGVSMQDNNIDFVEGTIEIDSMYDLYGVGYGGAPDTISDPVNASRIVLFPSKEYFVVVDDIVSTASHDYDFILHFGGTQINGNGDISEADTNSVLGNLTLGSTSVEWWNETTNAPTNYSTTENNIHNLTWDTFALKDDVHTADNVIRTTVYFEPVIDAIPNRTAYHWGSYNEGRLDTASGLYGADAWHPFTFNRRTGQNIKSMQVIYLTNESASETVPTIENLSVTGGSGDDYAVNVSNGTTQDIIIIGDSGTDYVAGWFGSDCDVGMARNTSGWEYFVCIAGTNISIDGTVLMLSDGNLDYAFANRTGENTTYKIKNTAQRNITFYVANSSIVNVTKDGAYLTEGTEWDQLSATSIWVDVTFASEVEIKIFGASAGAGAGDTTYPFFYDYARSPTIPNDDQDVQINVTVNETNNDTVILAFSVGSSETNYTVTTSTNNSYYHTVSKADYVTDDVITYYWWANDTTGNMNTSSSFSFTVTRPSINDTTGGSSTGDNGDDDDDDDDEPSDACTPNWICGSWGLCTDGIINRTCTDENNCGTIVDMPNNTVDCDLVLEIPIGNDTITIELPSIGITTGFLVLNGELGEAFMLTLTGLFHYYWSPSPSYGIFDFIFMHWVISLLAFGLLVGIGKKYIQSKNMYIIWIIISVLVSILISSLLPSV